MSAVMLPVLCQNSSGRQECGFGELIQRSDGVVGMVDHVEASVYDVGCCWRKAMAPRFMLQLMQMIFALVRNLFANRADLAIENLALRQQLAVLKRNRPRPRLDDMDRLA